MSILLKATDCQRFCWNEQSFVSRKTWEHCRYLSLLGGRLPGWFEWVLQWLCTSGIFLFCSPVISFYLFCLQFHFPLIYFCLHFILSMFQYTDKLRSYSCFTCLVIWSGNEEPALLRNDSPWTSIIAWHLEEICLSDQWEARLFTWDFILERQSICAAFQQRNGILFMFCKDWLEACTKGP